MSNILCHKNKLTKKNFLFIVIEIGDLLLARQYSKQGCAISQRFKLWSRMLNVEIDELVNIIHSNKT